MPSADENQEETAFLVELFAHPGDDTVRAIYADWLEERGDQRAEVLRIENQLAAAAPHSDAFLALQERLRKVRRGVNANWVMGVTRVGIENCQFNSDAECPQRWERLGTSRFPEVRTCWVCKADVHYCATMRDARQHTSQRRPVAVSWTLERTRGDLKRRE